MRRGKINNKNKVRVNMSGSLNKVMLIGRLGKDPEQRQTQSGTAVVNFSLATSEKFKDKDGSWQERTEWHRVVAFGSRAEVLAKYLKKGSPVYIDGALQTRDWEDKDGQKRYTTEIVMRDFQFLSSGESSGDRQQSTSQAPSSDINDDDIPW